MRGPLSRRGGVLYCGSLSLEELAACYGTPLFINDAGTLRESFHAWKEAFPSPALVAYAVKANSNQAVIRLFAGLGGGADVVSGGELQRALMAGVPPDRIVFSGVGKSPAEIDQAIAADIAQINIETPSEFDLIVARAQAAGKRVRCAPRVNPGIDVATHPKLATGQSGSKFGLPAGEAVALYRRLEETPCLAATGIALHLGSQIHTPARFREAFVQLRDLARALAVTGTAPATIDIGGGLGVDYACGPDGETRAPDIAGHAALAHGILGECGARLVTEPGRSLTAAAGMLLTRVLCVKKTPERLFAVLDASMTELIRPALYGASHSILPVCSHPGAPGCRVDFVGPVCESGDILGTDIILPVPRAGELVVVMHAGAYASVLSSTYNTRPLAAEIMTDGGRHALIRPRQSPEALIGRDLVPDFVPPAGAGDGPHGQAGHRAGHGDRPAGARDGT